MEHNWPGPDDHSVVEDMKRDRESLHWKECSLFIRNHLSKMNIPEDAKDDIAQQSLFVIWEKLNSFKYTGRLTAWIACIVRNKVRDYQRKYLREKGKFISVDTPKNVAIIEYLITAVPSAEDQYLQKYLQREELLFLQDLLKEFLTQYKNRERNARLLHLILLEGYTPREVKECLGVNLTIVQCICRDARKFMRAEYTKKERIHERIIDKCQY